MANLLQQSGAQPQKEPTYVPLFIDRAFTGLYTQRSVLHDPSDVYTSRYYGGRPDALWMGKNIELTNRLTLQRRPGLSLFSTVTYPTPPNTTYSFKLTNGTIQVIVDTGSTGSLTIASVATSSGTTAVYTGTFPLGGSNAYAGLVFLVTGFVGANNNGTYTCTASTTTTLTLSNSIATSETHAAAAISAGAVYVDNQNGTKTLLLAKAAGAGQGHFIAVAGVLYFGDGVDTRKYTPLNTNGTVWNWGGAAPTSPPSVVVVESGASAVSWAASTWFSTMGLLTDSNGNIEQLIAVTNGTQSGLSSAGQPAWNQATAGNTNDNGVIWQNIGPLAPWAPNTNYANQSAPGVGGTSSCIYDQITGTVYAMFRPGNASGTSGTTRPNFTGIPGSNVFNDGTCRWTCKGAIGTWLAGQTLAAPPGERFITEPIALPAAGQPLPAQPMYIQINTNAGTTSATNAAPNWGTSAGVQTLDNQLVWISLGTATWQSSHNYTAWTSPTSHTFSAVKDANGSFQVCIQSGLSGGSAPFSVWQSTHNYSTLGEQTVDSNGNLQRVAVTGISGGSAPAWSTTKGGTTAADGTVTWTNLGSAYGNITIDGTARWVNVGHNSTWLASKQYYLPKSGFNAPSGFDPYGSADINDGTNIEFVVHTGFSGSGTPSWNATVTGETVDNSIVWYNNGPSSPVSLVWTSGHVYAYSFKARALDDFYSTPVNGILPVPPGLTNPLPTPTGAETNTITTASPVFTIVGSNAGAVNTVSGVGSTDTQFDTIVIWRDADGGGPSNMFELTEIPMPPPIGGIAQPWSFLDFLPDAPTAAYPGLNPQIPAPIDHQNDPPSSAFLPMAYNFQRIWGTLGMTVPFSGGPDVVTGNSREAFLPSDSLPFLAPPMRLVKNTQGLLVFTTDSVEIILGGPQTATFFSVTLAPGIGLSNFNGLDLYAGEAFFFTADAQFFSMSPSLNVSAFGFPLGDQFVNMPSSGVSDATWDTSKVYVAVHQVGVDNSIIIADGSTGWYRVNPRQIPGAAQGPEPIWSPFAAITDGCKMVQSIETAPGVKHLLVGGVAGGKVIRMRDLSTYEDATGPGTLSGTVVEVLSHQGTGESTATLTWTESFQSGDTILLLASWNSTSGLGAWANRSISNDATSPTTGGLSQFSGDTPWASAWVETTAGAGSPGTVTVNFSESTTGLAVLAVHLRGLDPSQGDWTGAAAGDPTSPNYYAIPFNFAVARIASKNVVALTDGSFTTISLLGSGTSGYLGLAYKDTAAASVSFDVWSHSGSADLNYYTCFPYEVPPPPVDPITAPYDAWFTMGSITLAHPGQLALLKFLEFDFSGNSFHPTVSYLLNEISGTFTQMPMTPQFDPPSLYGTTLTPATYSPNRYYFSSNESLARCRHMQVKVDYGITGVGDEMYSMCIYGRLVIES